MLIAQTLLAASSVSATQATLAVESLAVRLQSKQYLFAYTHTSGTFGGAV